MHLSGSVRLMEKRDIGKVGETIERKRIRQIDNYGSTKDIKDTKAKKKNKKGGREGMYVENKKEETTTGLYRFSTKYLKYLREKIVGDER